jgi:hypothetical protein
MQAFQRVLYTWFHQGKLLTPLQLAALVFAAAAPLLLTGCLSFSTDAVPVFLPAGPKPALLL